MILQALTDYYHRKAEAAGPGQAALAPAGFEHKEIPFVLELDHAGQLVNLINTQQPVGKKLRARSYQVPQGVKKTSGVAANLLWDTVEYVLGIDTKGKPERVAQQHAAFVARLDELPADDAGMRAVRAFLADIPWDTLHAHPDWETLLTVNPVITFQLQDDFGELVCTRPAIVAHLQGGPASADNSAQGICLVSGETQPIARLHPAIKGVWGAQTSGANIVSFNQRAFESYGKEGRQGENAPVGEATVFAYTTALNHLLGKDSRQRLQVGDASTVFWAAQPCAMENSLADLFNEHKDNPDAHSQAVSALYRSVQHGQFVDEGGDTRFYVLGLAPNAARLSVRFWHCATVAELATRLVRHFDDLNIIRGPFDPPHLSLIRLLGCTALQGELKHLPPSLGGDTLRAILDDRPYPDTLLAACIRRIRAEQKVTYPRAALLKAWLNRWARAYPNAIHPQEDITVSLNPDRTDPGYCLGRLFAVLERLQERASSGRKLNATICDRFYGSASSNPVMVFPNLLKLAVHHHSKIAQHAPGEAVNLSKLLGSVMSKLDQFPTQLTLQDQALFALGYYHQKHDFFQKPDTDTAADAQGDAQ